MKKTGAELLRYALEQLPITHTFGIPGVHNTEIYDELNKSSRIEPVLVTHEGGAAFMADGMSRTSDTIGTLVIVPSAGVTHAMSGIGEAYLDGVPMLIISGGIRTDIDYKYQLHQWDQHQALKTVTKATWKISSHEEIVPTVFEAYRTAIGGVPGPVFIEIPVNIQLFKGDVNTLPEFESSDAFIATDSSALDAAVELINGSARIGIFAGWGARNASKNLILLAERLDAPVSTTLQGLSVFPHDHELHTGMGFGPASVPAAENAFREVDCLIAIGTRFSEIPTGSFGVKVPEKLIHIDIDREVFDQNYPAKVKIHGDADPVLQSLNELLDTRSVKKSNPQIKVKIKKDKAAFYKEWEEYKTDLVNPRLFFKSLRTQLQDDAILVVDDGNHTFLTAELYENYRSKHLISPTDFNCMGYCVPAAIGASLANPGKQVAAIVGDGSFLMTAMEILTATSQNVGAVYFVFHDGELSQIAQGQEIPYGRKVCTILGNIQLSGIAEATGAAFLEIDTNEKLDGVIQEALKISEKGRPVIVDVKIDYAKRTRFTRGVVKTVMSRFPLGDKFRFIGRALKRKITG